MNKKPSSLKPQDIVLALKLALSRKDDQSRMVDLAHELGLSQSEISQGFQRLFQSKLVDSSRRKLLRNNLYEFLVHGLKYAFPAISGPVQRGVPTAHSAPPLSRIIKSSAEAKLVWPWPEGEARGETILPLYPTVPNAAKKDPALYEVLALVDALRVGRAREYRIACDKLEKILLDQK